MESMVSVKIFYFIWFIPKEMPSIGYWLKTANYKTGTHFTGWHIC